MQMLHMTMDSTNTRPQWRTSLETAPTCPRCASPNTKFCYYNNYSLSQPRYFCKGCRRYWTKGGSLRNVPVGGGCRKNRRLKAAARAVAQQPSCSSPDSSNDPNSSPGGNSNNNSNSGVSAAEPSNIDLAAIFANYLNQSSSEASASSGGGQAASAASDRSSPELTHVSAEGNSRERLEEFHEHELEGFDLQGLLEGSKGNDEKLGEDMIWYEDASSGHSTWQRMAQLQEIQAFLFDDQNRLNPDGIGWSSFDLSTF